MSRQGIGFSSKRIINAGTLRDNQINSFSFKSKKFNLEQGTEQSGWILDFLTVPAARNYQQIFDIQHV